MGTASDQMKARQQGTSSEPGAWGASALQEEATQATQPSPAGHRGVVGPGSWHRSPLIPEDAWPPHPGSERFNLQTPRLARPCHVHTAPITKVVKAKKRK